VRRQHSRNLGKGAAIRPPRRPPRAITWSSPMPISSMHPKRFPGSLSR
jgi:hypothetical protein